MKRVDWSREELVLALDLYLREPRSRGNAAHHEVVELSELLRTLPANALHVVEEPRFRNPNGVGMKLANFTRFDPDNTGKGLPGGARLEEEIWNEFATDADKRSRAVAAIQRHIGEVETSAPPEDLEDEEAPEGALLTTVHQRRERNRSLVRRKKSSVLKKKGSLECDACGFDFGSTYGDVGNGFIGCHDEVPVSDLRPGSRTKLRDLAVLCANCHRMIHRSRPWLSVAELKQLLRAEGQAYNLANEELGRVLALAQSKGRICPKANRWLELWKLLASRTRSGALLDPPEQLKPLILGGWHFSSDWQKQDCFLSQIRWAAEHGSLDDVSSLLYSLSDDEWHYEKSNF